MNVFGTLFNGAKYTDKMKYLIYWRAIFSKETQKLNLAIIDCSLVKNAKWDYSYTDAFVYYLSQKS